MEKISNITEIFCKRCGSPKIEKCICPKLPDTVKSIRSCFLFDGVGKDLILKWKYNNIYFVKDFIEKRIIRNYPFGAIRFDAVIPVPIHFIRKILRGFNQSQIIAEIISKEFNVNNFSHLLKRIKFTKPQSLCNNYFEREKNINNAFKLSYELNLNKILIVDDIITSGTTLIEIAKFFPDTEIYFYSVAMAF